MDMMNTPSAFTAARIATAIGKTPQAIRQRLEGVRETCLHDVAGQEAKLWALESLPPKLRDELAKAARKHGYRDVITMLSLPPKQWRPSVPRREIVFEDWHRAKQLQRALTPSLTREDIGEISAERFENDGIADYEKEFGRIITRRYFRELMAMVQHRDGGVKNFARLELFLPAKLATQQKKAGRATEDERTEFADIIEVVQHGADMTEADRKEIWRLAFLHHERLISQGWKPKAAARKVREFLFRETKVASNRDTLLKAFAREHAIFVRDGGKTANLLKGHKENGREAYQWPQADIDTIDRLVAFHYGQHLPAWRHAYQGGLLTGATTEQFRAYAKQPNFIPKPLPSVLGQESRWLYTLARRRRDFNQLKAKFKTIYDGLHTLDVISADDVTLPVWFWYQADPSRPWVMTRGQCLVFIDVRSKRILGWSLQPSRNYNARVIVTQCKKVFSEKGVPRALNFELGVWERSKLIKGSGPFCINGITQGLRDVADIEFFHAYTPTGKWEMENVVGLIQNLMEDEPGYGGREERYDLPDSIKRQLAEVNPDKKLPVHPSKYFYSFEQWNARLEEIFVEYNNRVQGGDHMQDRSPNQIYVENWNHDDPPFKLNDRPELLPFFASDRLEMTVMPSGLQIGDFKYFGPETNERVGDRVIAWFDAETPDVLAVTDLDMKNPVFVPVHTGLPRFERLTNPNGTKTTEAIARREAQVRGMVARYRVLKDGWELPYRRHLSPPAHLAELSTALAEGKAKVRAERRQITRTENADRLTATNSINALRKVAEQEVD
jgi:hypothetical protein